MTVMRDRERGQPPALAARAGRRLRARAREQHGFTLIEMLVVISILGILGMIVSMSMIGLVAQAQQRANTEEQMTIQSAVNFMMVDQDIQPEDVCTGAAPAGTQDMAAFPSRGASLWPRYLRKEFMNRKYVCTVGGSVQPAP